MRWPKDADTTRRPRWALCEKQFSLRRTQDGKAYLTRWWIVNTPLGGLALHKITERDAREEVHDHPFTFVSFVLRGGYVEKRREPTSLDLYTRYVGTGDTLRTRFNIMRNRDAHTIVYAPVETWTLLFAGPKRREWGFWRETTTAARLRDIGHGRVSYHVVPAWEWVPHDHFDSGHLSYEDGGKS